jgi:hypothetical protein
MNAGVSCPDSEARLIVAAPSVASFGIEGHMQAYESSVVLDLKFLGANRREDCRIFKSTTPAAGRPDAEASDT